MKTLPFALLILAAPAGLLAQNTTYYDAPVVSAEPIVEVITRKIPYEQCRDEQVKVVQSGGAHSPTSGLLGATVATSRSPARYRPGLWR